MSEAEWSGWMAAAQRGDAQVYRRLLAEASVWLRRYFARRLPPAIVDDAVQDTLLAVHLKRHTYAPERPFAPWLAAIARYKWIDRLRSLRHAAAEPLDEEVPVEGHEQRVTTAYALDRLLGLLRPAQAQAIRLVKLEGYSVEEASAQTGQSVSLVKVNIHRGLARLGRLAREQDDAH